MSSSISSIEQKMQNVLMQQKLNTFDEEGKLRKFDIREDPEQKAKCDETMELLLAAGYFRVRIKGLSEFDKVVGGLAWSIQACNFTVDIDVLYQENAHLGQKLALTERIVVVLSRMKCPHAIEPHQIQGGDFIHIFPVIQWLVQQVFKRRAELGDSNRAFALNQYEKQFQKIQNDTIDEFWKENIEAIRNRHRPKRQYRCLEPLKKSKLTGEERRKRLDTVLVEFGQNHRLLIFSDESNEVEQPVAIIDKMMKSMVHEKSKITSRTINTLVNQQQEMLRTVIDDFQEKENLRLEEALASEPVQQLLAIRTFKTRIDQQNENLLTLKKMIDETMTRKEESKTKALQTSQELDDLKNEIQEIDRRSQDIDPEVLKRVENLVEIYERLKKDEQDTRTNYKKQSDELEAEINELEIRLEQCPSGFTADEEEKFTRLLEQHQLISERLQNKKLILAKKIQAISSISREIDEIPSAIELSQYRQAFFQLYNQSAVLYRQTKQNYTLYNTFTDMITYMNKEVDLLESVYQSYPQAILTANGKENFLKQLETIVDAVRQNRLKIERRKEEEKRKRDEINIQLSQLVDKARQYAKVLKDFQEAIRENESLLNLSDST